MLQVAATSDLMLAYLDFFLGGDEKRSILPPRLHQRFPMSIIFGGDGSYMAPFSLSSDNILTSVMSQVSSLQRQLSSYVNCFNCFFISIYWLILLSMCPLVYSTNYMVSISGWS